MKIERKMNDDLDLFIENFIINFILKHFFSNNINFNNCIFRFYFENLVYDNSFQI